MCPPRVLPAQPGAIRPLRRAGLAGRSTPPQPPPRSPPRALHKRAPQSAGRGAWGGGRGMLKPPLPQCRPPSWDLQEAGGGSALWVGGAGHTCLAGVGGEGKAECREQGWGGGGLWPCLAAAWDLGGSPWASGWEHLGQPMRAPPLKLQWNFTVSFPASNHQSPCPPTPIQHTPRCSPEPLRLQTASAQACAQGPPTHSLGGPRTQGLRAHVGSPAPA